MILSNTQIFCKCLLRECSADRVNILLILTPCDIDTLNKYLDFYCTVYLACCSRGSNGGRRGSWSKSSSGNERPLA
jgi:hypothetical protein